MTQREAVLAYLKKHRRSGMTSKDAIDYCACTRLSAVVNALRGDGNDIRSVRENAHTIYGTTSITRYFLK